MNENELLTNMGNEEYIEEKDSFIVDEPQNEQQNTTDTNISEIEQKKFIPSIWNILVLSVKYYANENFSKMVFLGILELMILCKNFFNAWSNVILDDINAKTQEEQRLKILKSTAMILTTHLLNYMADWVFEKNLSKYGSNICSIGLRNILYSSDSRINEINSAHAEFCIYEGSKAMAKISRNVLVDIPSKSIHLLCDIAIIFWADTTKYKVLFSIFLCGAIFLTLFKIVAIYKSMIYVPMITSQAAKRNKIFQDTLYNAPIIKSFGVEQKFIERYHKQSKRWVVYRRKHKFHLMTGEFISKCFTVIFRLTVAWYYIQNKPSSATGEVLKIMTIIKILMDTVKTLEKSSELFKKMSESIAECHIILSYMFLKLENKQNKIVLSDVIEGIKINNLNYTINNNQRVIFDDVSLDLKKGDWVVLYGKNGAGKSSLFKILQNYVNFGGSVLYDGVDVRNIYRPCLSKMITVVPQNTSLFEGSIYYNIQFYNEKASFSDVIQICKHINIHDTIMTFPRGYNTQVGENGSRLNGGLRQKIFYARAFLCDTPIYLFDEPTNNMDTESSKLLFKYMFESGKFLNKLLFVICHDFEVINSFPIKYKFTDKKICRIDRITPNDIDE
ncbi:hypothetical protein NUSPORA_01877 [Nucleospora cyclopteri]